MAIPSKFPVRVRTGSVTVKIYRQVREKAGRRYHSFTVDYTASGKRTLKAFADYEKAHDEATGIANKLAQGEIEVLQLTGADRAAYGHALAALKPTGVSLELAAKEFAEAYRILAGRTSVIEAAKSYVSRHRGCTGKEVSAAVEELYASKEKEGASDAYLKVLRCYLGKFSKSFQGPHRGRCDERNCRFLA